MPDLHEAAKARRQAIAECGRCDEQGWETGTDGLPADPARRCDHTDRADNWTDRLPTTSSSSPANGPS